MLYFFNLHKVSQAVRQQILNFTNIIINVPWTFTPSILLERFLEIYMSLSS